MSAGNSSVERLQDETAAANAKLADIAMDKEINIKIAEACGWTQKPMSRYVPSKITWRKPNQHALDSGYRKPPDYLNDRNVIIRAVIDTFGPTDDEREFCEGKWTDFGANLCEVCGYDQHERVWFSWDVYTATARQLCEAFIKTLEG